MAPLSRTRRDALSELPVLLHELHEAQTRLGAERGSERWLYPQAAASRLALLVALEAYAGALTATGFPLPYRLRDELFLYRRLTGSVRPTHLR